MTNTIEILDRLIAFDTVSSKSNLSLIAFVEEFLSNRGFKLTRVADKSGEKAGLFASLGPSGDGVLLSAHTDVVPVEGQDWSKNPFKLTKEGNKYYGRGTTDMKGYLASMLSIADRAANSELSEPLKLSISYDEEVGCLGIADMINDLPNALGQPRVAFVGEPTEMAVATGHKGKVGLKANARGEAGHSSLAPKFQNAIYVAVDLVTKLRELQDWYIANGARDTGYDIPFTTFHVGKFHGGTALNIVPDTAEMVFEFRHLAEDDPDEILAKIAEAAGEHINLEQTIRYPGLNTEIGSDAVQLAHRLAATNTTTKVAYGTEAGFFDALGIPTIVCGPGSMEGQGHKPDEYVTEDQLNACDAMMERILAEISVGGQRS